MKKLLLFSLSVLLFSLLPAQPFESQTIDIDKDCFKGWTPSGGGVMNPDGSIAVTGDGNDCTYWLSTPLDLTAGQTYMVRFLRKNSETNGGCGVTGLVSCNVDIPLTGSQWAPAQYVFSVPNSLENRNFRLGQWHAKATVQYANLRIVPVQPIYNKENGIELGDGESIVENEYIFSPEFGGTGRNFSRPLLYNTANFNTNRWVFGKDAKVVYKFSVNGRRQLSANLSTTVNYHVNGVLKAAASNDNEHWLPVGEQDGKGELKISLPKSLFPTDTIYISLTSETSRKTDAKDSDPGSFQINMLSYKAALAGPPTGMKGSTHFVEILDKDNDVIVSVDSLGDMLPGGDNTIFLDVDNRSDRKLTFTPRVVTDYVKGGESTSGQATFHCMPGRRRKIRLTYSISATGPFTLRVDLGGDSKFRMSTEGIVPEFYNSDYGELLSNDGNALWWASSGWKINTKRRLPGVPGKAIRISAARNEAEAAQLVITPNNDLKGVHVSVSDLTDNQGRVIPASAVDVLRVYYHNVTVKTDNTGMLGLWPDALPPIKPEGMTIPAGFNQPVWIRVNVPRDAPRSRYKGTVTVTADDGWKASVPLEVLVYGFTLPDTMTCEPAFGFNLSTAAQYHKATTFEQRKLLWQKYMDVFAKHHVSVYDPAQLAPFKAKLANSKPYWDHCSYLKDTPEPGKYAIHVIDDSPTASLTSNFSETFPIPEGGFVCSFRFKLPKPDEAMLSVRSFSADGLWMSGCNKSFTLKGDDTWREIVLELDGFKPGAKSIGFGILPAVWTKDGSKIGEITVADFILKEKISGKVLITPDSLKQNDLNDFTIEFDWTGWDHYVEEAFTKYHATTLRVLMEGLGGGNFDSRRAPVLFGFKEGTPEYDRLLPIYFGEVEKHLREKGWLDKAYVYWFDEPDPKDYEFVMNGFKKLKKYAPNIRRLLTEQVEPELVGGPNLWCPHKNRTSRQAVAERQADGDTYWWYISTACKAPYTGLFIDHPAMDMRVWLWQTWDYNVQGVLIWASNYWTSPAVYPNSLQNPYLDTMAWVPTDHRPFGNGDGRFIYPPEAAADGSQKDFVADDPVSCIRLEMFRDGMEDYEYFVILKKLLAAKGNTLLPTKRAEYEALLKVPAGVSASLTQFTTSPETLEWHRAKLAKAIAELQ